MRAQVNELTSVHLANDGYADIADVALLTASVIEADSEVVHELTFEELPEFTDLYISSSFTMLEEGSYHVVYSYDGTVVFSERLSVAYEILGDAPVGVPYWLSKHTTEGNFVWMTLHDYTGALVEDYIQAESSHELAVYYVENTFESTGTYYTVWYTSETEEGTKTPFTYDRLLVLQPPGKEAVRFIAGAGQDDEYNGEPHVGATVIVSDITGALCGTAVTDSVGEAVIELYPDDYIVSLVKGGCVYTSNNWEYGVYNSRALNENEDIIRTVQTKRLVTEVFEPTFTPYTSPVPTCLLYADIVKMDGTPLRNATVHVQSVDSVANSVSGVYVADMQNTHRTDSNGHVEFSVVHGMEVEISVAPLAIRRRVTVPDAETANFLELLSAADDMFDIVSPVVVTAPRRYL